MTVIGLIARREIITRLRSRPYRIGTAACVLVIVGVSLAIRPSAPTSVGDQRLALGIITSILIYLALLINGHALAQGIVEEKTSRVADVLLATVEPGQLMIGKVVGLGIVGLLQVTVIALGGITGGLLTGALRRQEVTAVGTLAWLAVWFILGYASYSLALAAVASAITRSEEVAPVVTPVLMVLAVGYVLGISVVPHDPTAPVVTTLSLIPVFAPTMMPVRLAVGGVPIWQSAVALAGLAATIPLLLAAATRIYRNAVLHGGTRSRLRDAWRG